MKTIAFAKKLRADMSVFQIYTPYPGTELYEICRKYGTLKEDITWRDFSPLVDYNKKLLFIGNGRGEEELKRLFKKAYRACYLSPSFIISRIPKLFNYNNFVRYSKGFMAVLKT